MQIYSCWADLSLENVLLANKKASAEREACNRRLIHVHSHKANVLQGGPVYLIDYSMATTKRFHTGHDREFGLSRSLSSDFFWIAGPACGKASYIAPEAGTCVSKKSVKSRDVLPSDAPG